ncbi:MAG: hypothetical protein ABIN01_11775 [Ferruginibacter sp.]
MKSVYFFSMLAIFLASCTVPRYMYSPSAQNVPVLVKQGDSKLSANYSTDFTGSPFGTSSNGTYNKNEGLDLQGAVALTNNFAIQANYFNRRERDYTDRENPKNSGINYKRELTEIGIGYFNSMHRRDKVMFQIFGGVGKGAFSFTDQVTDFTSPLVTKHHSADVFKIYFQPAFIFRVRENFGLSVSTRFSIIKFSNIQTDYTVLQLDDYRLRHLDYGSHVFFEPAFTNTFGFNKLPGVKFQYQILAALRISEPFIDHRSFNFSVGMLLDVSKLFKPAQAGEKN